MFDQNEIIRLSDALLIIDEAADKLIQSGVDGTDSRIARLDSIANLLEDLLCDLNAA